MKSLILLAVVSCFIGSSSAQVISWGSCPQVTVQDNFQLDKYLGRWYENRRFFTSFEAFSDCVTADYSLYEDGSVRVNNTGLNVYTGRPTTAIGKAVPSSDNSAKLGVRFSASAPEGDYWVLSTDYDSYSVVWSCTEVWIFNLQFGWILTREAEGLTVRKTWELYRMLNNMGINPRRFSVTNQNNCNRPQNGNF